MISPPVHIAGGGIAGLAAALALSPHHEVLILEQAASFSEVGAGLQLGPNAMRALQKLGAREAAEAITSSPPEIHMRDGVSGRLLKRLMLGPAFEARYGAPYRVAMRADLQAALLSVTKLNTKVQILNNMRVNHIDANPLGITLSANGENLKTQNLIATDGVHSKIRQQLFPNAAPVDSHEVFHRCLIAIPETSAVAMDCVNLWMFPGGHVVHYPVGSKSQLNLVAITPAGATPPQHFARAHDSLKSILALMPADRSPWPGLYAPAMQTWVKNGVMLLGDAAHATLPYLAQGAAMALEDAAMLAEVLPTTQTLNHAFAETAARRMTRTSRLQKASLSAGRTYHAKSIMRVLQNMVLPMVPESVLWMRLDWIYKK